MTHDVADPIAVPREEFEHFINALTHEIRNRLNSIALEAADLAEQAGPPADATRLQQHVQDCSAYLKKVRETLRPTIRTRQEVALYRFRQKAARKETSMKLTLGHSPDPDDAFMFYALAKHLLPTPGYEFEHILQDIQTLNERATRAELDITAISIHAYAYVLKDYALLRSGASMGDNYGPMIVGKKTFTREELRTKKDRRARPDDQRVSRPATFPRRAEGEAQLRRRAVRPDFRRRSRAARPTSA